MSDDDNKLVSVIGNHIYFYTDVNDSSALEAVKAIKKLNREIISATMTLVDDDVYDYIYDDTEDTDTKVEKYNPIYFHINSSGGSYFAGLAIIEAIRTSKVPVYTIGEGAIASMASLIFLYGKRRFISKHSYYLIHEIRTYMSGTFSNLTDEYDNCKLFMQRLTKMYQERCRIPNKKLKQLLKKDIWLSSEKCLKWKIAHKIV